jgi:hypothetical protein
MDVVSHAVGTPLTEFIRIVMEYSTSESVSLLYKAAISRVVIP